MLIAPQMPPASRTVPTYTQTLTLTPESPALARMSTRTTLECWGLTELVDDAMMVVSELVTNAVRHAHPLPADPGEPGRCRLTLERPEPDMVRVWVMDSSSRPVVRRTPDDDCETGRGLDVVDALATRWEVMTRLTGGKAVWAEVKAPA
ncbi:ATP-binding protein [Streptomyces sp. bgisy034]|uniref:ATP-binding protein n=1 Tax=Streptomyces sp. bgisy034 TaxID=3413774 RepID=UPI003EB95E27